MTVRSEYKIEELRKQIAAKRERTIKKAEEKFAHDSDIAARRDEWRKEAETAVRSLHRRLKTVSDSELASFRIKPAPSSSSWSSPERERDQAIWDANNAYDRAQRRLDAIKSDQGVISLTPSMLGDIFGL